MGLSRDAADAASVLLHEQRERERASSWGGHCGFCGRIGGGLYYRVGEREVCFPCARSIANAFEKGLGVHREDAP